MQPSGQGEVTEMVRGELHLPPLRSPQLRGGHDAGVVDQDVQRPVPVGDEGRDGRLISEIQRRDQDPLVAGAGRDVFGGTRASLDVAHGQGDLGVRARERPGGLDSDTGRAAGDDRTFAAQIDTRDDVGGRRLRAERGGDAVVIHVCASLSARSVRSIASVA